MGVGVGVKNSAGGRGGGERGGGEMKPEMERGRD